MYIPVFRNGTWVHYELPTTGIELWNQGLKLQVASVYATCLGKGYSKQKSSVFAECYANKQLYGLTYDKVIEETLTNLMV